jgi:PAS domain S-box-containing protein
MSASEGTASLRGSQAVLPGPEPLEVATIEIRWAVIFALFFILATTHELNPLNVIGLTIGALYTMGRVLLLLLGKPIPLGRAGIVAADMLFIVWLLFTIDASKLIYLYALFLMPVTLTVVWVRMRIGLLVAGVALLLTGIIFVTRVGPNIETLNFLIFTGVMVFGITYLSARGSASEVSKRLSIEMLAHQVERDRARLRALIDGIPDGLIAVNKEGIITFFNLSATSIVGKHNINLMGLPISQVVNTTAGINAVNVTEKVLNFGGKEQRDDLRIFVSGRSVLLSTSVAPILNNSGDIEGAIVVFRDISSEKVDEEDHKALTSVISHQLRTPVTAIEGYLSYLLGSQSLQYDDQTRQYIEKAHRSAGMLTELITDILAISQAESGKLQVELSSVQVDELVDEVAREQTPAALAKRLSIIVEPIPPLEPVITDRSKVREALSNVVENAIKYSAQGIITIKVSFDSSSVSIGVTDQGVGLNPEDQENIWHKFHRIENWETRTPAEGGGMGLYISRTLMQMIGGTITVRSDLGKGSTFTIIVPTSMRDPELARKVAQIEAHHSANVL